MSNGSTVWKRITHVQIYILSAVLLGNRLKYVSRGVPQTTAVTETSFGWDVNSILMLSTSMRWYAVPFSKENHPHTASTRVTTETAAVEISKSTTCDLCLTSYRKSHQTHNRSPHSNRTRNFHSAPCRLYSYLASVRPWTEDKIEHKFDEARVFERPPRNKPRNLNGDRTEAHGRVHVLRGCKVPCPQRHGRSGCCTLETV